MCPLTLHIDHVNARCDHHHLRVCKLISHRKAGHPAGKKVFDAVTVGGMLKEQRLNDIETGPEVEDDIVWLGYVATNVKRKTNVFQRLGWMSDCTKRT